MSMEHGANSHEEEAAKYPRTIELPHGGIRQVNSPEEERKLRQEDREQD